MCETLNIPNAETIEAMKEAKEIGSDPNTKTYSNFSEILAEVQDDMEQEHETTWDGWQDIYDEYFEKLKAAGASIFYVKAKYGFLRFEVEYNKNGKEINRLVHEAEVRSLNTCQDCGKEAKQVEIGGWIYTLCEDCAKKKKNHTIDN